MERLKKYVQSPLWRNPWVIFFPFFIFYLVLIFVFREKNMSGDTGRYLIYAENLIQGFYAFEGTKYLWNGPGYPLLLAPLLALGAPLFLMACLNAVFHYLSVVFLYKTIYRHADTSIALFFSFFWALYYPVYESLIAVLTESFTIFLVTMIAYYSSSYFSEGISGSNSRSKYLWILGGLLGYLALTKIIFGYVLLTMLLLVGLYWLISKDRVNSLRAASVIGVAFLVCLPYLVYTYQLTGRTFYWGNSGGLSLYWMSSPYPKEYGDWQAPQFNAEWQLRDIEAIKANHIADFAALDASALNEVHRDDRLKEMAVQNILQNPKKFFINWVANLNRMLFGLPYSYQLENLKFLKYLPPNLPLLTLMLYSFLILLLNFKAIPFELHFLLLMVLIYLSASSLLSAYPRMFHIILPILLFWVAYSISRTVRFRFFIEGE